LVYFRYQAQTWDRVLRLIAKLEWHVDEVLPRIGYVVTNSSLLRAKANKICIVRGEVENHIKEVKRMLR
jgi:hypothetical protein